MRQITLLSAVALVLTAVLFPFNPLGALLILTMVSCALATPTCDLRLTTLSVPVLLKEVMAAFRTTLLDLVGLTADFNSATARKGDTITGHIASLPALADYDASTGFSNGAVAADSLLTDVPVTLSNLKHVPVKIAWLTDISSKISLVPPAQNIGYVLVKHVIDDILSTSLTNVSHSTYLTPYSISLDTMESLRATCNSQKLGNPRWCILNSSLAEALQDDNRIGNALFYGQLNGEQGLRRWTNLAGFKSAVEYPDFPVGASSCAGLAFDRRLVALSVRGINDTGNIAKELGIPEIMSFDRATDDDGLSLTAVKWQQPGTGDVYLSFAILYGLAVGNQGGSPLAATDNAGLLIRSA